MWREKHGVNRKVIVLKNSSISLISQAITLVFAFITRSLFIQYIGIELLGINGTFASALNALSITEFGFQTAVIYRLYQPIYNKDIKKINDILNILKVVYRCIGLVFVVGSLVLLPFLKYMLVGIDLSMEYIYFYFLLQASASVSTYFFAYKRTLLYANQKEYFSKIIDVFVICLFNIAQCITIYKFKSYELYLLLKFGQTFVSNLIVHIFCTQVYPYLHKDKIDTKIFFEITKDVKNIFLGKIAGFIYSSTDNIIISILINTISVGYYGNYTIIVCNMKNLVNGLLTPITPIVGNYLVEENCKTKREDVLLLYTHVCFWIALLVICPLVVLIDDFIVIWLGQEYLLSTLLVMLLAVDFYIHIVHSALLDYINGMGLFRFEKYIEIQGALSNIIFSLIFAKFIGIEGVLIGTAISQCLFWLGRSIVVYYKGMQLCRKHFVLYWLRNSYYSIVFIICVNVCSILYSCVNTGPSVEKFIFGGILCEGCTIVLGLCMLFKFREQQTLHSLIKNLINN